MSATESEATTAALLTLQVISQTPEVLLEAIRDPALILAPDSSIVAANTGAQTLFGLAPTSQATQKLQSIVDAQDWHALAQFISSNPALKEWEYRQRSFIPSARQLHAEHNNLAGWILVLHDVTTLKTITRNQSEFMRVVSHDLRSPLTSMQGFASMMEMAGTLTEKQKHFVEKILSGITTMAALVENIQDAGRYDPESGFYEMSRSACDLGDIVAHVLESHLIPAEKTLDIQLNVSADVPVIFADVMMLERAINNLVDNAIKYTPSGGHIAVAVAVINDQLLVSIQDDGPGIPAQHLPHIFERHYRVVRPETKKVKGTGLGLFIVRSVAHRHGGEVWAESTEGQGSTFYMSIPHSGPNLLNPGSS